MKTRVLLTAGAIAGPLFVGTFLVAGATREGYDPLRIEISCLSLGDAGWVMVANFIVAGLLTLALAAGLWRLHDAKLRRARAGAVLVGLWGVGLIAEGIFTTDPVAGYHPGTANVPQETLHGNLHGAIGTLGAVALLAAFLVLAGGDARWTTYSIITAVLFVILSGLTMAGFNETSGLGGIAGLLQRSVHVVAWAWLTVLAIRARRLVRE